MAETRIITGPGPWCMTDGEARRIRERRHEQLMLEQARAAQRAEAQGIAVLRVRRRDVLVLLCEAEQITPEQRDAGHEIAKVHAYLSRDVEGKVTATYDERLPPSPSDDVPLRLSTPYRRYALWSDVAGKRTAKGPRTVRDVVIEVAAMNRGHRQIADAWRMDGRTVLRRLGEGLDLYLATRLADAA